MKIELLFQQRDGERQWAHFSRPGAGRSVVVEVPLGITDEALERIAEALEKLFPRPKNL